MFFVDAESITSQIRQKGLLQNYLSGGFQQSIPHNSKTE
jgi:hypothetical protein